MTKQSTPNHNLELLAQQALDQARRLGATQAEAAVSHGDGLSVTARLGEVETVEHHRDKSFVTSVYIGHQTGSASTSDFSQQAITDTVSAAIDIARFTEADPCLGLADKARLATSFRDLDCYHPWSLSVNGAIDLAKRCEQAGREHSRKISNSEGAAVSTQIGREFYANSHGFVHSSEGSRHSVSCSLLAKQDDSMQRDYWYSVARDAADLESAESIGQIAAIRTLRRLGARRIKTGQYPVIYEAPIAASLFSHFLGAISGSALYKQASFLLDQIGKPVFSSIINALEDPFIAKGLASANYDNEGVATASRVLVDQGVLGGYLLGSYSARKLSMESTGNAGGVHNLIIKPTTGGLDEMIREMGTGLVVTELMGHGVNSVTGDYSRGASGYWVENGDIQYPVEEITVAGNLKDIYQQMVAVGNDVEHQAKIQTGSLMIQSMTVAGD